MASSFDQDTLETWDTTSEIEIETTRGGDAPLHRTTIWIVRDGDNGYVRSVRGPAGRWYRELVANPRGAVLAGDSRVAIRAEPANDAESIARVSQALDKKYRTRWPGPTDAMLRDDTLPTTLRLERLS